MEKQMNRLTATFTSAMSKAMAAENKDDCVTHLKAMSNVFTQLCTALVTEESAKKRAVKERNELFRELAGLQAKADAHNDLIRQFHALLAAQCRKNSSDAASQRVFDRVFEDIVKNTLRLEDVCTVAAKLKLERRRNQRMTLHINELSKRNVMHLMATRFYARELAAMRQMMDLMRNASSIDAALKSRLWDEIEAENRLLRLNTLWLVNRINSSDMRDAPFEGGDNWQSPPRVVILMREHINQGLGLEITGGCDQFRPVVVSGKLKRSMADDDQLQIDDRILAVDGTFVTNTTTHQEVMEMLENESAKDFIALIVSQFDPDKYYADQSSSSTESTTTTSTTTSGESN